MGFETSELILQSVRLCSSQLFWWPRHFRSSLKVFLTKCKVTAASLQLTILPKHLTPHLRHTAEVKIINNRLFWWSYLHCRIDSFPIAARPCTALLRQLQLISTACQFKISDVVFVFILDQTPLSGPIFFLQAALLGFIQYSWPRHTSSAPQPRRFIVKCKTVP